MKEKLVRMLLILVTMVRSVIVTISNYLLISSFNVYILCLSLMKVSPFDISLSFSDENVFFDISICMFYLCSLSASTLKLLEKYTEEQQDVHTISEIVSDFDTKGLDSTAETTESKQSVPLSLVDDIGEIIIQDSVPEEVTLYVILEDGKEIEEKDDLKTSTSDITIHG